MERHNDILRRIVFRIDTELKRLGITMPFNILLGEANYVKNSMLEYGGQTPYTAVLGKNPRLLEILGDRDNMHNIGQIEDQGLIYDEPGIHCGTRNLR